MIPLKLKIEPSVNQSLLRAGDTITNITNGRKGFVIKEVHAGYVIVDMNLEMSAKDHVVCLSRVLPDHEVTVYVDKPPEIVTIKQPIKLDSTDLSVYDHAPCNVPVWANIFRKPSAVFDRAHWAESEEADKYIYIPNCTRFRGQDAEDSTSNSIYTEVMLNSYKLMCRQAEINPVVRLMSGQELPALSITPAQALQPNKVSEMVSGLAGSFLVDFDDSKYGKLFLQTIAALDQDYYHTETARMNVLSKSEFILSGKFSHTYNQRFVKQFLALVNNYYAPELAEAFGETVTEAATSLVGILRTMVIEGKVLEDSLESFKERAWSASLGQHIELLTELYNKAGDRG